MSNDLPATPVSANQPATRWCAPARSRPALTKHGLLDTTLIGREWYDGDSIDPVSSLAGAGYSYVLLAAGGAGKTTLIDELQHHEPGSVSVDLGMLSEQTLPAAIRAATSDHDIVYLDGLDEALQRIPRAGYMLATVLAEKDSLTTLWRLACRPGSWSPDLAKGLRDALPDFRELQLLPLDRSGIDQMAGTHAQPFWEAVEHDRLTNLLARPLDAQVLLNDWRDTGKLPASRSDAMHHSVRRLLAETGTFRPQRHQDDRRMRLVAERLAAVALFSGASRFQTGNTSALRTTTTTPTRATVTAPGADPDGVEHRALITDGSIAITSIPVEDEPDLPGAPISLDDLREVIATGLFAPAGDGDLAFVHQSYTEYLAASFLARRNVTDARLASLLGADTNGTTPGPMLEVLGWLLATSADVPKKLIDRNAKALLGTAGLELADHRTRHAIVGALLRGAADGSLDEGWGIDTSRLAHPDLADQLHEAATSASNRWEVFWIARLARHCLVFAAADDLISLAHDHSWPPFIRAEAVHSFAALAPVDRMTELEDLLHLPNTEDPDDELLEAALRALLRSRPDVDTIAKVLRPPRASHRVGGYSALLGELASLIQPDDALPLLHAVLPQLPRDGDYSYERLITNLIARVWEERDPEQLHELGTTLGLSRAGRIIRPRQPYPWQREDDQEHRRLVAQAALAVGRGATQDVGRRAALTVLDMGLISPSEIPWLIDWIRDAQAEDIDAGLFLLGRIAWNVPDAATADRILGVAEAHPAYAALGQFQGSVDLDDRPDWVTWQLEQQEPDSLLAAVDTAKQALIEAQDFPDTWWRVVAALTEDPYDTRVLDWDLTTRPLWPHLTDDERDAFWRTGLAYLEDRVPDPASWQHLESFNVSQVLPDWAGAYAVGTMALHRSDLLADLTATTWNTWAPTLVHAKRYGGADACLNAVRDAMPGGVREEVTQTLTEMARSDVTAVVHHPLSDLSNPELLRVVEEVARDERAAPEQRGMAVQLLAQEAPTVALGVARAAQSEKHRLREMSAALAALAPDEYVASVLADGELVDAYAIGEIDLSQLSSSFLARLVDRFVAAEPNDEPTDEPVPEANRRTSPRRSVRFSPNTEEDDLRRVRYRCLETMADRGLVADLERLALMASPAADEARHLLPRARQHEALAHWRPVEPATLLKVVAHGDARLVRDSGGLATVLLEQLSRIQTDIHGVPLYRSLWNGEPCEAASSPKVEDDISDWLANQLELRLSPHVVVDREIQVTRRRHAGVGTRIDITVSAPTGERLGRVAFEAKRVENRELLTALDAQLVEQYMKPRDYSHGIYIVYWAGVEVRPALWSKSHPDPAVLAEKLSEQAQHHLPDRHIHVVVLDIGPSK